MWRHSLRHTGVLQVHVEAEVFLEGRQAGADRLDRTFAAGVVPSHAETAHAETAEDPAEEEEELH